MSQNSARGVAWGGDLSGSTSMEQFVSSISGTGGAGGTVILNIMALQFAVGQSNPLINQAATTVADGYALTVQAQNATGATHNGGDLDLSSGSSGSGTAGSVNIQVGGTTQLSVAATGPVIPVPTVIINAQFTTFTSAGAVEINTSVPNSIMQFSTAEMNDASTNSGYISLTGGGNLGSGQGGNIYLQGGGGSSGQGAQILLFGGQGSTAGYVQVTAPSVRFLSAQTTPIIGQEDKTTNSGTGTTLTVQAQNETGTTSTGGPLHLSSGTGTTTAGPVVIQTGGTTRLTANATGVITIANLSTGVVHADASGNLTSSLIVNADISATANITVTKLAPGTAGQILLSNATPASTWTTMTADVTITSAGATTVTAIRNNTVSATPPTAGQYLIENSGATGSAWTSLSGDVTGSTGTPGSITVTKIQTNPVSATPATAGQFLIENSGATGSAWTTISGDATASAGTPGSLTITKINGTTAPTGTGNSIGNGLYVTVAGAGGTLAYSALNLGGGSGWVTGVLPVGNLPNLAGDVTGTITANTVVKIQNNSVSATPPTAGQFLIENSGATGSAWTSLSGDVTASTGTPGSITVTSIQNNTVTSGALTKGQFFVATSTSNWAATTLSGDVTESATTAGQLTVVAVNGTSVPATPSANQALIATSGTTATWALIANANVSATAAIAVSKLASGTSGQILQNNGTPTPTWTTVSGDVSITNAGATTVIAIQNNPVLAQSLTILQDGYVLTWHEAGPYWYAAPSTGGGGGGFTAGGDLAGSSVSQTVIGLYGKPLDSSLATIGATQDGYFLSWVNGSGDWQAVPGPSGSFSAGGDLTGSSSAQTVIAIQGNPVSATPATAGQFLIENSAATGSAWTSLSGDVTASVSTPGSITVTKIQGNAVQSGALSAADDGYVLTWHNASTQWEALPSTGGGGGSTVQTGYNYGSFLYVYPFVGINQTNSTTFVNAAFFEFDPTTLTAANGTRTITLRVIAETTGPQMTVQLYNYTAASVVTGSTLTTTSGTPATLVTGDLTANLTNGPATYIVQIEMASGLVTDRITLDMATINVTWS